jgi:dTDP-4-dehydrorhamnose reductase
MHKILVTGVNGQLGSELKKLSAWHPEFEFYFFDKEQLNIADTQSVASVFEQVQPQYCINCAAYTAVDKAESDREVAYQINAEGTGNIAIASAKYNTKFIHISTDYVFDGNGKEPYSEDYPTHPLNFYGLSKLEGEKACFEVNHEAIIIRTSWVYSSFGNNFVKTMLRLMSSKESINVVADQYGIPTYAADLARSLVEIITYPEWKAGLYHFSNTGNPITWFQFASAIKQETGSLCIVNPIPSSEYPTPARRPFYSVLNTSKIQTTFGITIPDWHKSLIACLDILKSEGAQ